MQAELRRTKEQIPYFVHIMFAPTDLSLKEIYFSEKGERCQCNNCNHRIQNVYVVQTQSGELKHYGSNCLAHHGIKPSTMINYWRKTRNVLKYQLKKAKTAEENLTKYAAELAFIDAYLSMTYNAFLESIQDHMRSGSRMSDKQIAAVRRFMERTNLDKLVEEEQPRIERYYRILELLEKLSRVHFGAYPGQTPYHSMRDQFAQRGDLSEKQIAFLEKVTTRFRKQWLK